MTDGTKALEVDIPARDASSAMQAAIERHLGHRVITCFSGGCGQEIGNGVIHYEVPKHEPLYCKPGHLKKIDLTNTMFDDDNIRRESILAKKRHALP